MATTKNEKKTTIERETYERDGVSYFSYFVKGKIRNKDVKAILKPLDIGGYEVLDIVFGDDKIASLVSVPFSMKDEVSGKEITGVTYEAQNIDSSTGEIYRCKVKPSRPSDKSLLEMIIAQ